MKDYSVCKPRISIVMPVYNAGLYLKDSISDILNQTYENFELICVDDGSTDQSLKVIEYFAQQDNRIRIITQENAGAGAARNRGMELAQGKYIMFLDTDDRFDTGYLFEMCSRAEQTHAQIVVCDAEVFDDQSGLVGYHDCKDWILDENFKYINDVFSYKDCSDEIFTFTEMLPWNKLFLLDIVRKHDIKFQEIPYNNDSFFVAIMMVLADKIAVVNKRMVYYRMGNDRSISSYQNKRTCPQYNFEMYLTIRNKLIQLKKYQEVSVGFAKFASKQIFGHSMAMTEDNLHVYRKYFDNGYTKQVGLDMLTKDDFYDEEMFRDIECLCERGTDAFMARMIHRVSDMYSYYEKYYRERQLVLTSTCEYFNIANIKEGEKIVLYGAGMRGRYLWKKINDNGKYKIVAWVDRKAEYEDMKVNDCCIKRPCEILNLDYDYVVIAIENVDVMQQIKSDLKKIGVNESKIVW